MKEIIKTKKEIIDEIIKLSLTSFYSSIIHCHNEHIIHFIDTLRDLNEKGKLEHVAINDLEMLYQSAGFKEMIEKAVSFIESKGIEEE